LIGAWGKGNRNRTRVAARRHRVTRCTIRRLRREEALRDDGAIVAASVAKLPQHKWHYDGRQKMRRGRISFGKAASWCRLASRRRGTFASEQISVALRERPLCGAGQGRARHLAALSSDRPDAAEAAETGGWSSRVMDQPRSNKCSPLFEPGAKCSWLASVPRWPSRQA